MRNKKLDNLVLQLENYCECWKQFSRYLSAARAKKFDQEDENQFLDMKGLITQELEIIMSSIDCANPSRDDVHALLSSAPSIRYLSELNEGGMRGLENQWHKIYIAWQSLLGQLKVQQRQAGKKGLFSGMFKK